MSTNDQAGEQTGTLAERPAPESQRAGFLWTAPDETVYQVKRDPMTGAQTWQPIAGPGAAGAAGWSKYVVAPATGPAAPYQSIQAAIDAAVADGHTRSIPTTVLIFPGTYSETVTLAPGVNLVGLAARDGEGVSIQQALNAAFANANDRVNVENIAVNAGCALGGTSKAIWRFRNCRFLGLLTNGLTVTNTGGSILVLEGCDVQAPGGSDRPLSVQATTEVRIRETTIGTDPLNVAVALAGATTVVLRDSDVQGAWTLAGTSRVSAYRSLFAAQSQPLATLVAGTAFSIFPGCHTDCDSAPVFAGTGGAVAFAEPGIGNELSAVKAITLAPIGMGRGHVTQDFSANPGPLSNILDRAYFNGLLGPIACPLPDSADTYDGRTLAILKDASAQTVTITPSGTDVINYGPLVLAANAAHGVVVSLCRAAGRWDVVSIY